MNPSAAPGSPAAAFAHPGPAYFPVPIWWWSGDALDPQRLRWQMEQLLAGGVRSAVVMNLAPSGALYGALADDPGFFTEEWWEIFDGVCSDAHQRGFTLWFYDQLGFSGADIQGRVVRADPTCRGQILDRVTAIASEPVELRCPADAQVLAGFVVAVDEAGAATGPPEPLDPDGGVVSWSGAGRHRVSLVYAADRGFDYLSPTACAALFDAVHGEFERRVGTWFGTTIVGSFQDELPSMPSWSSSFACEFSRRCGYRLEDRIDALWEDTAPDAGVVRGDYQRTRAELAEEAFFRPLYTWHAERGMTVGCDQQHPARAGYPLEASQQYGDYLRTHRWFSAPGSDHWGDAKIHSSLAHLYGRPRTWVEAFHSTGWGGTLEETFDWLVPWLRAGATLYDPHAVYYSTRGASWEWAPPSTCWRQPYWRHYQLFGTTVARLCSVLTWGSHVCDVAVLFPTATVQAELALDEPEALLGRPPGTSAAQDAYLGVVGTMHWFEPQPGALERDGRDFDVVDDDSIVRGVLDGRELVIGDERYRVLVLPSCGVIEARTLAAIVAFGEAGGSVVVVGDLPAATADAGNPGTALDRFHELLAAGRVRRVADADGLATALADEPRRVDAPVPTLLRGDGESWVLLVPAAHPGATAVDRTWKTTGYDFDPARYRRVMTVAVRGLAEPVAVWDPGTGISTPLRVERQADRLVVEVPLTGSPCALVVFGPAAATVLDPPETPLTMAAGEELPVDPDEVPADAWSATLIPTLDNRWGEFGPPSERVRPQVWRLGHATGEEPPTDETSWSTVRVTEAAWGLAAGPARPEDLPGVLQPGDAPAWHAEPPWRPVVYSPASGVPTNSNSDPKGYVPDEFLDFGEVVSGQAVQVRFRIRCETAESACLTIGSTAGVQAWWNGAPVRLTSSVYYARAEVAALAGDNVLEVRLTASTTRRLRASWMLRAGADSRPAPEWLTVPGGVSATLTGRLLLSAAPSAACVQLGSVGRVLLSVNGTVVAQHGEFDNYAHVRTPRVRYYDIGTLLVRGENRVTVELCEENSAVCVDAIAVSGDARIFLATDASWEAVRAGETVAVAGVAEVPHDPRWIQLEPRSHPLAHGGRLQGLPAEEPFGAVTCVGDVGGVQWFRFRLPPGATAIRLPAAGAITVHVDGTPVEREGEDFVLPAPATGGAWCLVRVLAPNGLAGGALWSGPVEITRWTEGPTRLADWSELGLADYSGAVRYRAIVTGGADTAAVDLGALRGTAELRVNGRAAGCRLWSPYRFDVAGMFHAGENQIEVDVYNTLAPYFGAAGTTPWVLPGQRDSGLLGPVRLAAAAGQNVGVVRHDV